MPLYQAKHKSRGRYGVVDSNGQWLAEFLGDKQEAIVKAQALNQEKPSMVGKTSKPIHSNNKPLQHFILTEQGWLNKGE